ncbi:MAG TPA: N-acetylmuramoyl-L-alanine amidase, partial [Minicystis sp.]|nr:N-acetylmuramoyl-L-alanine amidase [Minicystis sp.]
GAALARTAADLRARLWRVDQSAADAREALELYAAASLADRDEAGCRADHARAVLAGELARDASVTYRELYLASRRQTVLAAKRSAASPCVVSLGLSLAELVAYRPQGEAMRALEREGNATADVAERGGAIVEASSNASAAKPASAPAPSPAASIASEAKVGPAGDVVIAPKEEAVPKGPVRITGIERFGGEQGARVVLSLSGPATFQVGNLAAEGSKDARIFVDIAHASAKGIPRETDVGGVVRRVRVGAHPSKGTRVVLDLAASLYRRVFYLPDPFRIVIDVSTRPPGREDKREGGGGREVHRVVIDPGHGGTDSGAVGPTGLKEKDVTLDIAHRVAPLLSHELKVETLLTRDDDTYVPLDLRTARANAFHADLFVSVHCNASENGAARGVQTFVLSEARDAEGIAARVAARENAQRGRAIDPKSSDEAAAIASSLDFGLLGRSRHVADLLQRSALGSLLVRYPDTKDQGIKTAGFFVLVGADMPAVLFETAFISNPEDESRLAKADYRQKLADAIANAIKAYRAGK